MFQVVVYHRMNWTMRSQSLNMHFLGAQKIRIFILDHVAQLKGSVWFDYLMDRRSFAF